MTIRPKAQGSRPRWGTVATLVLAVSLVAFAQVPQTPAREVSAPRVGTGSISGMVVTDESDPQPLRRVRVAIESGAFEIPGGTVTDDAGRFVFAALPAGNFTLGTQKAGYVPAVYGAKRPGDRNGLAIALRDGQSVTGLTIRMARGGVITGRVRQPNGQPAAGVSIMVTRARGGGATSLMDLASAGAITTDDRGVYRAFGLAPGDYVVQARMERIFTMFTNAGRRVTPEEIAWAERATAGGAAITPVTTPPPDPGPPVAYATVFYPGTTQALSAGIVGVAAGQERQGIDIGLEYVPVARVSGTIVGPDGRPAARLEVALSGAGEDESNPLMRLMSRTQVRTQPDGTFAADNVMPGRYVLSVRGAAENPKPPNPAQLMGRGLFGMLGMANAGMTLWAREEIDVNGRDIANLQLQLQPGMIVRGRVVVEATTHPAFDVANSSVMLSTVPTSATGGSNAQEAAALAVMGAMTGTAASPNADGTFEVKGVLPGRYRIGAFAPGMLPGGIPGAPQPTWILASVTVGGRDIADLPIDVRPNEELRDVVVTLSDRISELSGTVFDELGRPTPGFPIVVFPTDRRYWLPGSSRIRQARPSSDGSFKFEGLPAGEYYVCAATDLEPNDLNDPAFLEQLTARTFKLTIAPGEKKKQDVKLTGGG